MNYNPFSLEYKRILITGAGSGIGRSIAIEAAKMGAILLLVDINIDALNETVGMLESENCSVYQINLANYNEILDFVELIDPIDGLVNNAGISNTKPLHFISEEELLKNHKGIPHGGVVFRSGVTGLAHKNKHIIEYRLQLDSNPEFTASVLTAYARAAYRLNREGQFGCKTVLDIAPAYLHQGTPEELREKLL